MLFGFKYGAIIIFIGSVAMILNSCGDCEFLADQYRKDQFNILLQHEPTEGRAYTLKGINPITKRKERYSDQGGFLGLPFKNLISIGDTLVKKHGELKIYIRKKDTIIIYPFKCEGQIYE